MGMDGKWGKGKNKRKSRGMGVRVDDGIKEVKG